MDASNLAFEAAGTYWTTATPGKRRAASPARAPASAKPAAAAKKKAKPAAKATKPSIAKRALGAVRADPVYFTLVVVAACMLGPCLDHVLDLPHLSGRVAALGSPFDLLPTTMAASVALTETAGTLLIISLYAPRIGAAAAPTHPGSAA